MLARKRCLGTRIQRDCFSKAKGPSSRSKLWVVIGLSHSGTGNTLAKQSCIQAQHRSTWSENGPSNMCNVGSTWLNMGPNHESYSPPLPPPKLAGHFGAVLEADGHRLKSCQGRAELSTICPNHIKAPSCFQVSFRAPPPRVSSLIECSWCVKDAADNTWWDRKVHVSSKPCWGVLPEQLSLIRLKAIWKSFDSDMRVSLVCLACIQSSSIPQVIREQTRACGVTPTSNSDYLRLILELGFVRFRQDSFCMLHRSDLGL